jgi:hypothetical protein
MKEGKVEGTCRTHGDENYIKILVGKFEGTKSLT